MKTLLKGIQFGVGLMIVIFLGFFVIRADWESPTSLKALGNDTVLTVSRWNALIDKLTWVDMSTDTAKFDPTCDRKIVSTTGATQYYLLADQVGEDRMYHNFSTTDKRFNILYSAKTTPVSQWNSMSGWTIDKVIKRCN